MRRIFLVILVVGWGLGSIWGQAIGQRTIVNEEQSPIVYIQLAGARAAEIGTRTAAIQLLGSGRHRLETVAPNGMWRVGTDPTTLVGYFVGGQAAVGYRLFVVELGRGDRPITISRRNLLATTTGETVGLAPWELPERAEPVLVDGNAIEWQDVDPLLRLAYFATPKRIEDGTNGSELRASQAQLWNRGGTAVITMSSAAGAQAWYVAIRTRNDISDGTAYHLRVYERRSESSVPIAEFSALVDAESGPVVLSRADGSVSLAGEYALSQDFIEIEIDRRVLEGLVDNVFRSNASFDIASSRRMESRSERFSHGTVLFSDVTR